VETALAAGTPFLEVTRRVQQFRHDLVITDGGRGEDAGRAMDSTTMHLMRKCPCAIWVARPTHGDRYQRILAAVDPDPTDAERHSLNRTIMELAVSLAEREASELHAVHAWQQYGLPVGSSAQVWQQWQEAACAEVNRRFCEFLSEYPLGSDSRVHLVGGKPAHSISRLAREEQIDVLVMGTVCRTGIRGFFIGNTAEGILRRVDCSLLTVKPEGFVSPIEPVGVPASGEAIGNG
jgi:nucleotide-binding universal stress UspA family protein